MKTRNIGVVMEQGADFNLVIGVRDSSGPTDLTGYSFLGDMRLSTDPTGPVAGGVKAKATITMNALPLAGDTLTVNGTVVTFVAATPGANEVLIGASATDTFISLLQFLKASVNVNIILATYAYQSNLVILVTYQTTGVIGNAFTLTTTSAGIALSSATLLGGVEPAKFVFTILNQATNKGQVQCSLPLVVINTLAASISNDLQTCRLKTPYVFDIKMKDTASTVKRIIQGIVYFSPQATQEVFP